MKTNFEHYKDEILEITNFSRSGFAIDELITAFVKESSDNIYDY